MAGDYPTTTPDGNAVKTQRVTLPMSEATSRRAGRQAFAPMEPKVCLSACADARQNAPNGGLRWWCSPCLSPLPCLRATMPATRLQNVLGWPAGLSPLRRHAECMQGYRRPCMGILAVVFVLHFLHRAVPAQEHRFMPLPMLRFVPASVLHFVWCRMLHHVHASVVLMERRLEMPLDRHKPMLLVMHRVDLRQRRPCTTPS